MGMMKDQHADDICRNCRECIEREDNEAGQRALYPNYPSKVVVDKKIWEEKNRDSGK